MASTRISADTKHMTDTGDHSSKEHTDAEDDTQASSRPPTDEAPDGGPRAWLVAAGGGAVYFCCLGFTNTFGAFQAYYLVHHLSHKSADSIAWIGSVTAFLQFAVGIIAGPLFDRYHTKVIYPSAAAYVFTLMMLSICKEYWQVMITQGLMLGVFMGFLQVPVNAAVAHWFRKKRALAMGFVASGASLGGVVIPIAVSSMLNSSSLGFGWTVRIIGFIVIPLLSFACLTIRTRVPPRKTDFWAPETLRNKRFLVLIVACFFALMGMYVPIFNLPTYARSRGMSATLSGYLLAVLNGASTFGRIVPGILADKFGRINIFAGACIASSIVIYCMDEAKSNAALIVYAGVYGFCSGAIISGCGVVVSVCTNDLQKMGTYMGMGLFVASFGTLIGSPVSVALVERYGGYLQLAMLSGTVTLVGGLVTILAKLLTPEGILGRV